MSSGNDPFFDAIVIGAGFSGLYQLYKLRSMGMSVKGFEMAADIGGTWFQNRYPGCRVDTESYVYGYSWCEELASGWNWSERFIGQPEVLEYIRWAEKRMDVRKDYTFNARVVSAEYDATRNDWTVTLEDGSTASCRYLISATGPLSIPQMPSYAGIDRYQGELYSSFFWPHDPSGGTGPAPTDFRGKRVGVVGTGSTGVQIITEVAKTAGELFVFQRTPNWCVPLGNAPLSEEDRAQIRAELPQQIALCMETFAGFPHKFSETSALEAAPEERERFFSQLYKAPGYGMWLGNYHDVLFDKDANAVVAEFVARKVRERVKDPAIAEKLIPTNHPFGSKRVPMESGYYEVFNQPNVHLVDLREDPIKELTETGIATQGGVEYPLDVIIFATGFDAVTGALDRIRIVGDKGQTLKDVWAEGPQTYLGLQIVGFPNFFTLVAAHNGASFCNIPLCGQHQVEWVSSMLAHMRDHGMSYAEPIQAAEDKWTASVYETIAKTLLADADSWFLGVNTNVAGRQERKSLVYAGGGPAYRATCAKVADNGYEGFELRRAC
ncbi:MULTISPECIES: flavin-containing monooxygenase [Sphingobium]|uniref:flavin-containing monooxygenase n=1 Tax=Sphingobium sp. MI1205 TaxID=407020 RepID=UPI00076FFBFF|nr:NAD(P)/FAD-dependent oxidoreductase [Sphingobium sp. MI1205]AMK19967.1 cyclohexanone monooxygenase [Sphingobium sp. MI1205]